jgi:hypothetical protein
MSRWLLNAAFCLAAMVVILTAPVQASSPVFTAVETAASGTCPAIPAAKTSFLGTDAQVWLDYAYTGGNAGDIYLVQWIEPNGNVYVTNSSTQTAAGGSYCSNWNINIAGYTPASLPGTWSVKLLVNNSLSTTRTFSITSVPSMQLSATTVSVALKSPISAVITPQSISITANGAPLTFQVSSSTYDPGYKAVPNWLNLTVSAGVLGIGIKPNAVQQGVGIIVITAAGVSNSGQVITVNPSCYNDPSGFIDPGGSCVDQSPATGGDYSPPKVLPSSIVLSSPGSTSTQVSVTTSAPFPPPPGGSAPVATNATATVRYPSDQTAQWLSVPSSFSPTAKITVGMSSSVNLSPGTYYAWIDFNTTCGTFGVCSTAATTVFVTLNVTAAQSAIPGSGGAGSSTPSTYYFSQLAFGGSYQTTLTYINYSPQTVTCTTSFYSDSGGSLALPFSQGTISTRTDVLGPGGSIHDPTTASLAGTAMQGWAVASCTGPVEASVLFRNYNQAGAAVGEASVTAETAPATTFVTFAQTKTGVAYANPSTTQSAVVTFTVFSSTGAQLGSTNITLPPMSHSAAQVDTLLPALQAFTGSIQITSTVPIISLSLNFESTISSLPPGDLTSSSASAGPQTYYFSHLAFAGNYQTTLTYINYSTESVTCTTSFYTDYGGVLSVPFSDGTYATRTDYLAPGGSIHRPTTASLSTAAQQAWAQASCTGPVQASVLFRNYNQAGTALGEASVTAETAPATKFVTFAQTSTGAVQSSTGVAFANPSTSQAASVTFTVISSAGVQLGSTKVTVGILSHSAALLSSLLPSLSNFTGSLQITSTAPIISLSLNFEATPVFSSLPPGDLDSSTQLGSQ